MLVGTRDYLIKDIYENLDLSVRAYNICCELQVRTIRDLHNFIKVRKGFEGVRNCGSKTSLELLQIHKEYFLNSFDDKGDAVDLEFKKDNLNFLSSQKNIDALVNIEFNKLGKRAYNIFFEYFGNKVPTLLEINKNIIEKKFYPKKIRNVGSKTVLEIEFFIQRVMDIIDLNKNSSLLFSIKDNSKDITLKLIDNSVFQSVNFRLNSIIGIEFNKLTNRAYNALYRMFENSVPNAESIKMMFIDERFYPHKMQNVGFKTASEISKFKDFCIKIYNENINYKISDIEIASAEIFRKSGVEISNQNYLNKYLERNFPILTAAFEVFIESAELDDMSFFLIKNYFNCFERHYSLAEMGTKFNLSPESVRRKQIVAVDKLGKNISRFKAIISESNLKDLVNNNSVFIIQEDFLDLFFPVSERKFGIEFASFALGQIFSDEYFLFSPFDKLNRPKVVSDFINYNKFKSLKRYYLIKNDLINKIELIELCNFILKELSVKYDKERFFNVSEIINREISTNILMEFAIVLKKEFSVYSKNLFICFPRNLKIKRYEYVEKALIEIDKLSTLSEILSKLKCLYPDKVFSTDSVRNVLSSEKKLFIIERRQISLYGLLVWENMKEGVKGGTIGELTVAFILKNKKPCHVKKIINYIKTFRSNTTSESIITILKTGKSKKRLNFYKGGLIGVKEEYKKDQLLGYTKVSIDELIDDLFDY